MSDRLARQIAFFPEADKLKTILRRTPLTDASRPENSAEHSWHLGATLNRKAGPERATGDDMQELSEI